MVKKRTSDEYEIPDKPEDVHTLRDLIGFVIKNSGYPEIKDALKNIYHSDKEKGKRIMSKEAYHQYLKGSAVGERTERKLKMRLKELDYDIDYSPNGQVKINKIGKLKVEDSAYVSQLEKVSIDNSFSKSDKFVYQKILELDSRVSNIERRLKIK